MPSQSTLARARQDKRQAPAKRERNHHLRNGRFQAHGRDVERFGLAGHLDIIRGASRRNRRERGRELSDLAADRAARSLLKSRHEAG